MKLDRICAGALWLALGTAALAQGTTPDRPSERAPEVLPPAGVGAPGAQLSPAAPGLPVPAPATSSAPAAPTAQGLSAAQMQEIVDAAKATATATRQSVEYGRTVPDLLAQILAKLDKVEDKLAKVEDAVKEGRGPRRGAARP